MLDMKRILLAIPAAAALVAAGVPAAASASIVELGQTKSPIVAPVCPPKGSPASCTIILTRTTAVETLRDGKKYPTTVKKAGRIVAFTLGLSQLDPNRSTRNADIRFLNSQYGGPATVQLTVLAPSGPRRQFGWTVVGMTPVYHVRQYLGTVAQFPLLNTLSVKPGYVIALTTQTWAPVLSILQPTRKFGYRQSRQGPGCGSPPVTSAAQTTIGQTAQYKCRYLGTRVEYSATEVTSPVPSGL
jgi:hypothetical protein